MHTIMLYKVKVVMDQFIEGLKTLFVHCSAILYPQQIEMIFCLLDVKLISNEI